MAKRARRKNERLLGWLRGAGIALAVYAGLTSMQFRPGWGAALLALLAGSLAVASVDVGVTVAVLCLAVPLVAVNPVLGIALTILAVVSVRYLGADGGRVFLLMAAAVFGAFFGPIWAPVAIAGFLMGATEGAVAAAAACLAVEGVGIALGSGALPAGVTITGGSVPLVTFAGAPPSLFSSQWIPQAFANINSGSVDTLINGIAAVPNPLALALQPLMWAFGAVVTATLARQASKHRGIVPLAAAMAAGVLVPAAGSIMLGASAGLSTEWSALAFATVSSVLLGALFAVVYQNGFPVVAAPVRSSVATEDAEVDDLLRLIATAEEKLATQHTTTKVVMITDMKSFSRITEEDGSIVTAKFIQRHRDLLLPIIEAHHGRGKSTGGDGLVAAFDRPIDALKAAADMQRALSEHNGAHHVGRDMSVRMGVARGEVVLDKSGRPFIGAALNLAARIMNLADGGQVFADASLLSIETSAVKTHSHGEFELKNIARPVEVIEVLWTHDQQPRTPGDTVAAPE